MLHGGLVEIMLRLHDIPLQKGQICAKMEQNGILSRDNMQIRQKFKKSLRPSFNFYNLIPELPNVRVSIVTISKPGHLAMATKHQYVVEVSNSFSNDSILIICHFHHFVSSVLH